MMRRGQTWNLALGTLAVAATAFAAATPAEKCVSGKIKAAAKMTAVVFKCERASAIKGTAVSQSCISAAGGALTIAFAHLEAKHGCPITDNAMAVMTDVDILTSQVTTDIGSATGGSTTTTTMPASCLHCQDLASGTVGTACPGSQALADAFNTCTCGTGPCATPCVDTCTMGQPTSPQCSTCLSDTVSGCGNETQACLNDV